MRVSLCRGLLRTWSASLGGSAALVPFFEWAEFLEIGCAGLACAFAGSVGNVALAISARRNPVALAITHAILSLIHI